MRPALFAVLLAVPLTACDPLFFVEVEERRICFEQTQPVDAAPPIGDQTVSWEDSVDLSDDMPEHGAVTGEIRLLGARVTGSTSLAGVSGAAITAWIPGTQQDTLASYTQPAVVQEPNVLAFTGSPSVNLLDYLDATTLGYRIELSGAPPTTPWDATVEVCLSMKVMVDVLEAAQE
jgi:hypothetical protein